MAIEIPAFLAEQNERAAARGAALGRMFVEGKRHRLARDQFEEAKRRGEAQEGLTRDQFEEAKRRGEAQEGLTRDQFEEAKRRGEAQESLWNLQSQGERLDNLLKTIKGEQALAAQKLAVQQQALIGQAMEFESTLDFSKPAEALSSTAKFVQTHPQLAFSEWHKGVMERIDKATAAQAWSSRIDKQVQGRKEVAEASAATRMNIAKLQSQDRQMWARMRKEASTENMGARKWRSELDEWSDAYATGLEATDQDEPWTVRQAAAKAYADNFRTEWLKVKDEMLKRQPEPAPGRSDDIDWQGAIGRFKFGIPRQ